MKYSKETSIDHHLRATWHAVAKMYNEEAAKHNSTMATAFLLLTIDKKKGTASTSLGPKMGMEPTSLSRLIKSLEEKKLIIREKNPADGRSVLVKLTELGNEKRDISKAQVIRFNTKVREVVNEKELEIFFEVTTKINKLIEEKSVFE